MATTETPIERFASLILKRPLYPYQAEIANAIIAAIDRNQGDIITVMLSRQSGKNQLSAIVEAFLLWQRQEGNIIKAAPTFKPQILNSRLRLLKMLDNDFTRDRIWKSFGYIVGLAPSPDKAQIKNQAGPRVMFFSAGPEGNVVGATADIMLEIDEAQDVDPEKFDRDFRPMAATTNAVTVMYGTAWTDITLLAMQKAQNLEIEEKTGVKLHFEYDWTVPARINPNYKKFVEREIDRLGIDHPAIQTQYFLQPIAGAGYFFNGLHRHNLKGQHPWMEDPGDDRGAYIMGIDVAGEDRPLTNTVKGGDAPKTSTTNSSGKRDSTIASIGRVRYNEFGMSVVEVVYQAWWTGLDFQEQFVNIAALIEIWGVIKVCIDSTGIGANLFSNLRGRYGEEMVQEFWFTRPSKSKLANNFLAFVGQDRFHIYRKEGAPFRIYTECWHQINKARYRAPAPDVIDFYVQQSDGHDDFLMSLALLANAAEEFKAPASSGYVRSKADYQGEGRF